MVADKRVPRENSQQMKILEDDQLGSPDRKSDQKVAKIESGASTRGAVDKLKKRLQKDSLRYFDRKNKIPYFVIRVKYGRHRKFFPLEADLDAAVSKARELKAHLKLHGWEKTVEVYRPGDGVRTSDLTIGEFIKLAELHGEIHPRTFHCYARKLRRLVGGIKRFTHQGSDKYDCSPEGTAWRKAVHAVPLEDLTAAAIVAWRGRFLAARPSHGRERIKAEHTANTIVRNARSLFSKRILKKLQVAVPGLCLISPFADVELLPESDSDYFYVSKVDVRVLIERAFAELKGEELAVFILAIGGGLRRSEIDNLDWSLIDLVEGTILIMPGAVKRLKSEKSRGTVILEKRFVDALKALQGKRRGFVIRPEQAARYVETYSYYRAKLVFDGVCTWLRNYGLTDTDQLIHLLRKEYGSNIAKKHGIHAACASLRQSSIALTAKHYADRKGEKTSYFEAPVSRPTDTLLVTEIVQRLKAEGLVMQIPR